MGKNILETLTGAAVLAVAGAFLYYAYSTSNIRNVQGYELIASFSSVAGVSPGSDVRIGGIKIGSIASMTLDPKTYHAVLHLQIRDDVAVPADSSAAIVSDGLLGSKYVKIEPGAEERSLKSGQAIPYTQSSVNLEELIGKMVFSGGGVDKGGAKKDAGSAPAASPAPPASPAPAR
jgi:phospholipid/cholesterol/gamma-HCH transport system substrate-binding protein